MRGVFWRFVGMSLLNEWFTKKEASKVYFKLSNEYIMSASMKSHWLKLKICPPREAFEHFEGWELNGFWPWVRTNLYKPTLEAINRPTPPSFSHSPPPKKEDLEGKLMSILSGLTSWTWNVCLIKEQIFSDVLEMFICLELPLLYLHQLCFCMTVQFLWIRY